MGTSFVYNSGEREVDKKKLELTFGLFFDGTLNSRKYEVIE